MTNPYEISDDTPVYVISVAAELSGMHPQTLRAYDRLGLVSPGRSAGRGRGRRYSLRDILVLREVQRLSQAGVSLPGIKRIMELEDRAGPVPRAPSPSWPPRWRSSGPSSSRPGRWPPGSPGCCAAAGRAARWSRCGTGGPAGPGAASRVGGRPRPGPGPAAREPGPDLPAAGTAGDPPPESG